LFDVKNYMLSKGSPYERFSNLAVGKFRFTWKENGLYTKKMGSEEKTGFRSCLTAER